MRFGRDLVIDMAPDQFLFAGMIVETTIGFGQGPLVVASVIVAKGATPLRQDTGIVSDRQKGSSPSWVGEIAETLILIGPVPVFED